MMNEITNVRPSPIAGTWYSANPKQLRQTLDRYMQDADLPDLPGEVIGLVAPHAGYRYSGPVAGHAFKAVRGRHFDHVAILSPMHQYYSRPILTSAHGAYRTPLGDIPLAKGLLSEMDQTLQDQSGLSLAPISNDEEHSLEIELPFLQRALDGPFDLIPIMLRDQSRQIAQTLGEVLAGVIRNESCLLLASTDLSHFHSQTKANQLDQQVLRQLQDCSPEGLFELKSQGQGEACGLAPMAVVLWAARNLGAKDVTLLNYDTSASATGDTSSVVGYGAAAITRPE